MKKRYRTLIESKLTMKNFIEYCSKKILTDFDGYGKYAMENERTEIVVMPSDIRKGNLNRLYTHVVWFSNR